MKTTKKHGMVGKRNAAKPPGERISGRAVSFAAGDLLPRIETAASAEGITRSAWLRRAAEAALEREGH